MSCTVILRREGTGYCFLMMQMCLGVPHHPLCSGKQPNYAPGSYWWLITRISTDCFFLLPVASWSVLSPCRSWLTLQSGSEPLVCKLLTPLHPFCGFHVFLSSLYPVDFWDDFHLLLVQEFKVRTILIAVRALSLPLCHFPQHLPTWPPTLHHHHHQSVCNLRTWLCNWMPLEPCTALPAPWGKSPSLPCTRQLGVQQVLFSVKKQKSCGSSAGSFSTTVPWYNYKARFIQGHFPWGFSRANMKLSGRCTRVVVCSLEKWLSSTRHWLWGQMMVLHWAGARDEFLIHGRFLSLPPPKCAPMS